MAKESWKSLKKVNPYLTKYSEYTELKQKHNDLIDDYKTNELLLSKEEKKQILKMIKKISNILEIYKFLNYDPLPLQKQFHSATAHTRLALGGNRSGKSFCKVNETMMHMTGIYPDWFPEHNRMPIPNFGRIVVSDYEHGGGVLNNYMFKDDKLLPQDAIKHIKYYKNIPQYIWMKNGCECEILSADADIEKHAGDKKHWIWIDEPISQDKFGENQMRLVDYSGDMSMTMTLIKQKHMWVIDEIYDESDDDPDVFSIIFPQDSNIYLNDSAKKMALKGISDAEKEARTSGMPSQLQGRIYKIWQNDAHVIEDFEIPKDHGTKRMVIDPHDRRPFAMGWFWTAPDGNTYLYRCYPVGSFGNEFHRIRYTEHSISQYINIILDSERYADGSYEKIYERLIDPNYGRRKSITSNTSIQNALEDESGGRLRFYDKINDDLETGHLKVSEYLYYDNKRPVDILNKPKLFIFKSCYNAWYQMRRYAWLEPSSLQEGYHGISNRIEQKYKDFPDLVRYCVMGGLVPIEDKVKPDSSLKHGTLAYYENMIEHQRRKDNKNNLKAYC